MTTWNRPPNRSRPLLVPLALLAALAAGCAVTNTRQRPEDGSVVDPDTGAPAYCGNGALEGDEQCDDGNLLPGDGCSPQCRIEACDPTTCHAGCCTTLGECAGGVADSACGQGGVSCQDCTDAGGFCHEQGCIANSDCTPGDAMACGLCGTRPCEADGTWGDCDAQGACLPDAVEVTGSCGDCGQLVRTCGQDCQWGPEACTGEGVCAAGDVELGGPCGSCGQERRSCNGQCLWESWTCALQGTCPITGGTCCAGQCVDTDSDPAHCGGCSTTCAAGQQCCTGDCASLLHDDDHCGSCGNPCGASAQCCTGSCQGYVCVTGGSAPRNEQQNGVPADPTCPQGQLAVGVLTERHWSWTWKYQVCAEGAVAGAVTTCDGEVGVCAPPACPAATTEVALYVDRSGGAIPIQHRICLAEVSAGELLGCAHPISQNDCDPPACVAGDVEVASFVDVDTAANTTFEYRLCVTPVCPPACH